MPTTPAALLGFGFVLGIRHALDVDHLAAVSTILSERRSLWRSSLVGAVWGLGHTAALLVVAILMIALHTEIPPRVAMTLELGVAAMSMVLGAPLVLVGDRFARAEGTVRVCAAVGSVVVGVLLAWEISVGASHL